MNAITQTNYPKCPCCGAEVSPLDLIVDAATGFISYGGATERFTPAEFRLIKALIDRYPAVLTKDQCYDFLTADSSEPPTPKIVDVKICQMRHRADRLSLAITTIWGVGYRLELSEPAKAEVLRNQRFEATRRVRSAIDHGDVSAVKMLRAQGFPLTEIARRLRMTFRAVTAAIDILEKETGGVLGKSKAA